MNALPPSRLVAALARLMKLFPAYASYLKTSRDAILGACSQDGTHGLILKALADGANTYSDLQQVTGFAPSFLHRHLSQLIASGQVWTITEQVRGNFRPRKLFFLTENKVNPDNE